MPRHRYRDRPMPFNVGDRVRVRQVPEGTEGWAARSDFALIVFRVTEVRRNGRGDDTVLVEPIRPAEHVCAWNSFKPEDLELSPDPAEVTAAHCGQLAARMQSRVDAMIERDGSAQAAVTGPGIGIGFVFARDIVLALQAASALLETKGDKG